MNPPPLDIVLPHMMEKNMKSTERPSSSTTFEKDDSLDRLMDLDIDDFLLSETPNSQPLDHGSHYENMAGGGCNLYSNILCGQNFPLSTSEMELDLLIDKAGPENLNLFDPYLQPNNALDFKSSPTFLGLEENWIF
ncbi:conserved hypothetical protein [Ricinus communis]|uniref:Uncharacterized protein n=2 Tax=Ricinus communis TaxID=3988 RepID=B9RRC7_RICCO|nr:conserved hypothetical protein [Ricinus communis]